MRARRNPTSYRLQILSHHKSWMKPRLRQDDAIRPREQRQQPNGLLLTLFLCSLALPGRAIQPDTNTLLLLHFETNLVGVAGETPTSASGVTYENGVAGFGARFAPGNQVLFPATNNIVATNGALEFWIKPNWNGNDGQGHAVLMFGGAGGLFFFKDGGNYWRSIGNRYGLGGHPEVGAGFNISSEWRSNEWHHAAFTWTQQSLKVYVDGQLRAQSAINYLPPISAPTFQLGADGSGSYADALLDELRISDRERTADEIVQSFISDLVVTGLSVQPASTNLLQPWWHTPVLTATSAVGVIQVPASAVSWTSSNTNVASADASGKIIARGAGTATLTAALNGASATLTVNVSAPLLPPDVDPIDPSLATPATNALYEMPVLVINFLPTRDGVHVDNTLLDNSTIADFKSKLTLFNKRVKFMLEEGSRFRGYSNAAARPSLGYRVVRIVTAYEIMPPGRLAGSGNFFPDYLQILDRFGAGNLVTNQNVKEVWLWGYHTAGIVPVESDMSSPASGDISNSYRDPTDLPVYDRTFVLYNYNSMHTQAEAVHNHGHQLESILSFIAQRQDGNSDLFWKKFCGQNDDGTFQQGRCGNTHFPPNGTNDYDYNDPVAVLSDCMDWTPPKTGRLAPVNASTWGGLPYAWPDGILPPQQTESQYYIFWMQNMPGCLNGIRYGSNVMANWWEFTADWDNAVRQNRGLYHAPRVQFTNAVIPPGRTNFSCSLVGDAGFGYTVEASTDFVQWTNLAATTNFRGSWQISDLPLLPRRFYRARQSGN